MKSVASGVPLPFAHLLLAMLLPVGALATQARSSMAVSVQVVRGYYSTATAALIETSESRNPGRLAIKSDADCKAVTGIVDGVWATCSWDPESRAYLVTVQY